MARILSLETSTTVCSVALYENEKLLAMAEVHQEHSHSAKLAILIEEVARVADMELREVNAIAVSSGPGSYTGLRIGTSTAKGLCYALSIPLIAIGTLELMAAQVNKVNLTKAWLCPMIDARRMEVYCRLSDAENNVIQEVEAKIIDEKSFEEHLNHKSIIFFGNGAEKCQSIIRHNNASFITGINPSAVQLGIMALLKYQHHDLEDVVQFEPFYLKEFRIKKPANLKIDVVPNKIA
jgi:tRNA threonylcarbamoyladenosine biosynthesis protein TsaB